jgi:O-methyltransferase involved in polyketide biosynthesis
LDARAFRLTWPGEKKCGFVHRQHLFSTFLCTENTIVYEIDREEMLNWKDQKLKEINAQITCTRRIGYGVPPSA